MLKPLWLDDEVEILALLNWFAKRFVDKPKRSQPPGRTLKVDFFASGEQGNQSWWFLKQLSPDLVTIRPNAKRHQYDPEWSGARVSCALENQQCLFDLLEFKPDDNMAAWRKSLLEQQETLNSIGIDFEFLSANPIYFPDRSNQELLQCLVNMVREGQSRHTLREISAHYFWGDSKFLDTRGDWLTRVLPCIQFAPRKIQINFFLPEIYDQLLFVENLDSYHRLIENPQSSTDKMALIYASGYRLSAGRIRQKPSASLHQELQSRGDNAAFVNWWFKQSDSSMQCFFWGDLDFSGLGILKSLRAQFDKMQLWQPGYEAMKQAVLNGNGHCYSVRDKESQKDPGQTGCRYGDQVILPLLRETSLCFDQEGIDPSGL
ncbi:MAG: hypothetical protein GY820_31525 [Gammaproteobacteria bacterium]|nr:hypothetical protein [Gammaproteobacteria bacterium]